MRASVLTSLNDWSDDLDLFRVPHIAEPRAGDLDNTHFHLITEETMFWPKSRIRCGRFESIVSEFIIRERLSAFDCNRGSISPTNDICVCVKCSHAIAQRSPLSFFVLFIYFISYHFFRCCPETIQPRQVSHWTFMWEEEEKEEETITAASWTIRSPSAFIVHSTCTEKCRQAAGVCVLV